MSIDFTKGWTKVDLKKECDALRDEFIHSGPHGDEIRATVIWQDDQQVTQAMWDSIINERDALRVELDDASHELAQLKMQLSPTRDVPKPGQAEAERWQEEAIRLSKKIGGMDYTISEMQKSVEKALRIEYRESDAKASWDWLVRQIEILRDNDEEDTKIRPPKAGVDYAATVEVDWPRLVDSAKLEALVERKVTEVIRRLGIKP